ncbi:MAG: hypothetical protein HQL18_00895 [Candidatus Omnitrophica bacterium]|nr:hypothetical protein [Candidatus Omnitrophota bacterium]
MKKTLAFLIVSVLVLAPSIAWATRTVVPFTGTLDFKNSRVSLAVGNKGGQTLNLDVARVAPTRYQLQAHVSHVKTPLLGDVATVLKGNLELVTLDSGHRSFVGELASQYTLLNYRPMRDIFLKFAVRDQKLKIDSLWAGTLSGRGEIDLTGQKGMNLSLSLLSVDLEQFVAFLNRGQDMHSFPVSGLVTGTLNLQGPFNRPDVQGHLVAYNGQLKNIDYDTITIDFDGIYPLLRLREVVLTQREGLTAKVAGSLDLSQLASLGDQVKLLKGIPIVSKESNREAWVLKRTNSSEDSKTDMSYFLMKDERGNSSGVLGIQKSIGF